ncbi:MAG: hypothetical protein ACUVSD_08485 [Thiobacillaceae bacterium]
MGADCMTVRSLVATLLMASVWPLHAAADALPLAQRYCTTCHGLARLAYQRHTPAGWWWLTQRMRWINGATVPDEQVVPLARELANAYPAAHAQALKEYMVLVLPIAAVLGGIACRYRRRPARPQADKE